jgi:hypothetical protein
MGNIWGTQDQMYGPNPYTPTGDVSCPAATITTVVTAASFPALSAGNYIPSITGWLALTLGATPASAIQVAFQLNGGANVDSFNVFPALLLANANILIPIQLRGVNGDAVWRPPGATITVSLNPTSQAVTCRQVGSRVLVYLLRGPDA